MSKPFCCIEAVRLYAAKIGLPESEVDKFFDYYSSNGWCVGRVKMKSYEAAMRNWKRNWEERRGRIAQPTTPLWKTIEILEKAVNCHEANPQSLIFDSRKVSDAMRADLKSKRAKLATLKTQQLESI